jgi:quercetin dioxygenase-like cupin family protein
MNRISKYALAVGIMAVSVLTVRAIAQDRATVVPGMKVLLDNECVRVQYHDVAVGQTAPMHSHPNYVVYTLRPFKARIRLKDGTQRISQRKAGEAYWNPAITHSVENLGKTPIHNLIVELKPGASCH